MRPLFHEIGRARSTELFTLATLMVAVGAAWATHAVGLSLALGGFLRRDDNARNRADHPQSSGGIGQFLHRIEAVLWRAEVQLRIAAETVHPVVANFEGVLTVVVVGDTVSRRAQERQREVDRRT